MQPKGTLALVTMSIVVYLTLVMGPRFAGRPEMMPFFAWDLFTSIPVHVATPALYVNAVGGQQLESPTPLFASGLHRGRDYVAYSYGRALGRALAADPERAAELRDILVDDHLPAGATWSVVLEEYEPLTRWREGTVERIELARFTTPTADPLSAALDPDAGTVTLADGVLPLDPRPAGAVEEVARDGGWWFIRGWAGDPEAGVVPDRLVVLVDGEARYSGGVGGRRGDVSARFDSPGLRRCGFQLFVPASGPDGPPVTLAVIAIFPDVARPVPLASGS